MPSTKHNKMQTCPAQNTTKCIHAQHKTQQNAGTSITNHNKMQTYPAQNITKCTHTQHKTQQNAHSQHKIQHNALAVPSTKQNEMQSNPAQTLLYGYCLVSLYKYEKLLVYTKEIWYSGSFIRPYRPIFIPAGTRITKL
jgi:hypothetical protein